MKNTNSNLKNLVQKIANKNVEFFFTFWVNGRIKLQLNQIRNFTKTFWKVHLLFQIPKLNSSTSKKISTSAWIFSWDHRKNTWMRARGQKRGCKIWEIRNIILVKAPKNTLLWNYGFFIIIILNWTGSFSQIQTHTLKGSILTLF